MIVVQSSAFSLFFGSSNRVNVAFSVCSFVKLFPGTWSHFQFVSRYFWTIKSFTAGTSASACGSRCSPHNAHCDTVIPALAKATAGNTESASYIFFITFSSRRAEKRRQQSFFIGTPLTPPAAATQEPRLHNVLWRTRALWSRTVF